MIWDYFLLALSNLKHRGLRSWLTMLGIFIGIAAVVSFISMGQGLQTAITGQFSSLSADMLTIQNSGTGFGPPGSTAVRKLTSHDLELIESARGVAQAVSRLIRIVYFEYNDVRVYRYVVSMPMDQKQIDFIHNSFGFKAESGKLLKETDK